MIKRSVSFSVFFFLILIICKAQTNNYTENLLSQHNNNSGTGRLTISQDPAIDSLIYRYILYNEKLNGMEGFRIQIYSSSDKKAREESGKVRQEFMTKFPDIVSYASFDKPGYYKIRAGDYRSRVEGTRYLLMVRKVFPDAYLVPDIINFPDQKKK